METSAEKKRRSAERKANSAINNSPSKALYSFSRASRFQNYKHQSATDIRFYDTKSSLYNRNLSFTTSRRTQFSKKDNIPAPNAYSPNIQSIIKKNSIQFKSGREACKANSVFQPNTNPGPGQYNPENIKDTKYKSLFYSLGKKIQVKNKNSMETPGPIYTIESTMLDKNKHLSIYVRRNSTKICGSNTMPRKPKNTTQPISEKVKQNSQSAYITHNGKRVFGYQGPFPVQSQEKRIFQKQIKDEKPGPGYYSSFSEFPENNENM